MLEALVVGIIILVLVTALSRFLSPRMSLVASGALAHLLLEATGANKWYCETVRS
jgi:hypothetical protein